MATLALSRDLARTSRHGRRVGGVGQGRAVGCREHDARRCASGISRREPRLQRVDGLLGLGARDREAGGGRAGQRRGGDARAHQQQDPAQRQPAVDEGGSAEPIQERSHRDSLWKLPGTEAERFRGHRQLRDRPPVNRGWELDGRSVMITINGDQPPHSSTMRPCMLRPIGPLRIDAARNRGQIVEAAQAAFAERGLDVPLEDVAGRAGVGIATLYRRFPTRQELIAACFERRVAEYARAAEEALEAADPWIGFCAYVQRVCAMQAADRGLKDVLNRTFPDAKTLEAHRRRGYDLIVRLIERAKDAGTLREDFVPEDLALLLMANAGVVRQSGLRHPMHGARIRRPHARGVPR